jgi:ABC-type branched-subunit amino acid transport system substrate-binding protein
MRSCLSRVLLLTLTVALSHSATLKIGYLYPFSSSTWTLESFTMFRLAIEHVNANASVLANDTLSFAAVSSGGLEHVAYAAAQTLLSDSAVVGLAGIGYSSAFSAPAMLASSLAKPLVSPGAGSPGLSDKVPFPYGLRTYASVYDRIVGLVAIVRDLGWTHLAAIGTRDDYGEAVYSVLQEQCELQGVSIVQYASHERKPSAHSLEAAACTIRDSRARIVLLLSISSDVTHGDGIAPALRACGLANEGYVLLSVLSSVDWAGAKFALEGLLYTQPHRPSSARRADLLEEWTRVTTQYDAASHGAFDSASGAPLYTANSQQYWRSANSEPSSWALLMYDCVWFFAVAMDALRRSGGDPLDGTQLKAALLTTRLEGVTGSIVLDPETQDRMAELSLYQVQPNATSGILEGVEIGRLPRTSAELTPWLHSSARLHWVGDRDATAQQPLDGISAAEVTAGLLLPYGLEGNESAGVTLLSQHLSCAATLAMHHLNQRDGAVVPLLASVPASSTRLQLRAFDTMGTPPGGLDAYGAAVQAGAFALIGPVYSSVTIPIATSSLGLPQISPTATSYALADKALYPGFWRVHPSDPQVAAALISTIRMNFWTWTRVGVVHVNDAYGDSFLEGLRAATALSSDIQVVVSASYNPGLPESMEVAVAMLEDAGVSIIICVAFEAELPLLLELAEGRGLLSRSHGWVLLDAILDAATLDLAFARRLHGMLAFSYTADAGSGYARLNATWARLLPADCSNRLFTPEPSMFAQPPISHAALIYDAVVALGLATLAPSVDAYEVNAVNTAIRTLNFTGATGHVAFDASGNGNRANSGASYALYNMVLTEASSSATGGDRRRAQQAAASTPYEFETRRVLLATQDDESTAEASSLPLRGQQACPCLQAWQTPPEVASDGSLIARIDGQSYRYPPAYGLGTCASHDLDTAPFCNVPSPPTWCRRAWCYIEPSDCSADFSQSSYFGQNYFFSYSTCTTQTLSVPITWKGGVGDTPVDLYALGCPAGEQPRAGVAGGIEICEACPAGTFKAIRAKLPCTKCEAGSVQPGKGATQCNVCGAEAFFCDAQGLAAPRVVQMGHISTPADGSANNRTGEAPCPEGAWCSAGIAVPCATGTYSDLSLPLAQRVSSASCLACPLHTTTAEPTAGRLGAASADECVCASGRVALPGGGCGCDAKTAYSPASDTCEVCPERTTSHAGASTCDMCAEGYFRASASMPASPTACEPCLNGALCSDENTTLATINVTKQGWRVGPYSRQLWPCLIAIDRGSGMAVSPCIGGSVSGNLGEVRASRA